MQCVSHFKFSDTQAQGYSQPRILYPATSYSSILNIGLFLYTKFIGFFLFEDYEPISSFS